MKVTNDRLKARAEQLQKAGIKIRTGSDSYQPPPAKVPAAPDALAEEIRKAWITKRR